jgi:hypothetical protein
VSIEEWLLVSLTSGAGVVGQMRAASGGAGAVTMLCRLLAGAVTCDLRFVNRPCDRLDQMGL